VKSSLASEVCTFGRHKQLGTEYAAGKVDIMRTSAGLLMYRIRDGGLEVFLAHPGGPFFTHKDEGHWTIPKGEVQPGEDLLGTAIREFEEETGIRTDVGSRFLPLGAIRQKGGKIVHAWAIEKDWDESQPISSNQFEAEWPPGSGKLQCFPEVDRAGFFTLAEAKRKLKKEQFALVEQLAKLLEENK
jgi:predicted NUDIX family NTP pyrophosphohydrolase